MPRPVTRVGVGGLPLGILLLVLCLLLPWMESKSHPRASRTPPQPSAALEDGAVLEHQTLLDDGRVTVETTRYSKSCGELIVGKELPAEKSLPRRCLELSITNKSGSPITAWVATSELLSPEGRRISWGSHAMDSILFEHDQQIRSRDTHRVDLGDQAKVEFKAVIFSDGSSSGDPTWVDRIVKNRRQEYQDIATALKTLRAACQSGASAADVIQQLKDLQRQKYAGLRPSDPNLSMMPIFEIVSTNLQLAPPAGGGSQVSLDAKISALTPNLLSMARRILNALPPISDHPVPVGEPLDSHTP